MEFEIISYWTYEKGKWDYNKNKYVERTISEVKEKILKIRMDKSLYKNDPTQTISFIGGPTGYESYYFIDLIKNFTDFTDDDFCICGGTINSWARCWVKTKDFKEILNQIQENNNEH